MARRVPIGAANGQGRKQAGLAARLLAALSPRATA